MSFESEKSRMEALCSRRECCSAEILEKLKRSGLSESDSAEILQSLRRSGYIDDSRYAAAFARDRSSLSGWGAAKIAFQLRRKGISDEILRSALSAIDSSKASSRLHEVLLVKWKELRREDDMQKKRNKALRFATGRGYSFDEALKVINELEKGNNNDYNNRAD